MPKQLDFETISHLLPPKPLAEADTELLRSWLADDPKIEGHVPQQLCQLDPRDGNMVIYNASRALRHHDLEEVALTEHDEHEGCPICEGIETRFVDYTPLSQGFTFISQNLYPILFPCERMNESLLDKPLYPDPERNGRATYGMHLLQWTSSIHELDWHNMPLADLEITVQRLAELEQRLLTTSEGYMPPSDALADKFGHLSVIKNFGAPAGASLSHGHQQISFCNIMPQRSFHDWSFQRRHQRSFSNFLLSENPANLTIADLGEAVLLIPYFMRRPLHMMLHLKTTGTGYLHELSAAQLSAMTRGVQLGVKLLRAAMPALNCEPAFNYAWHIGPGNDLYVEFFPITQAMGGFERMGMWICQQHPEDSAQLLTKVMQREGLGL
ncbi:MULTISPECIES: hypothetical protein [Corallincola]|uniref:Galactose-1-phosphate uridylyltransferase n=2 Tax=Corallincola TaxID=1775176 RepID=A0ABY1WQK8_9GAMM|nr:MULTISPECIES: hypothetical protein [Corallincola]TAA47002.1 hypothetical protein EXY25_07070 [Corallincola spongiicola]TCI04658.1 hypothetical protein EZV61_01395 [Corallincola luteus]